MILRVRLDDGVRTGCPDGEGIAAVEIGRDRDGPVQRDEHASNPQLAHSPHPVTGGILEHRAIDGGKSGTGGGVTKIHPVAGAQNHVQVHLVGSRGEAVLRVRLDDSVNARRRDGKGVRAVEIGRGRDDPVQRHEHTSNPRLVHVHHSVTIGVLEHGAMDGGQAGADQHIAKVHLVTVTQGDVHVHLVGRGRKVAGRVGHAVHDRAILEHTEQITRSCVPSFWDHRGGEESGIRLNDGVHARCRDRKGIVASEIGGRRDRSIERDEHVGNPKLAHVPHPVTVGVLEHRAGDGGTMGTDCRHLDPVRRNPLAKVVGGLCAGDVGPILDDRSRRQDIVHPHREADRHLRA